VDSHNSGHKIMADVTGCEVQAVTNAQSAGAVGAALTAAIGHGTLPGYGAIASLVGVDRTFRPDRSRTTDYDRLSDAFRAAYGTSSKLGDMLNR
jgi:xylulokinase